MSQRVECLCCCERRLGAVERAVSWLRPLSVLPVLCLLNLAPQAHGAVADFHFGVVGHDISKVVNGEAVLVGGTGFEQTKAIVVLGSLQPVGKST